jgi:hypothetical protein
MSNVRLVDVLTLIALIAGPALAVAVQLFFEKRRERRRSRVAILDTLLAYRGRLVNPECVNALNRVELAFYGEPVVIAKHRELIEHMERERNFPESEQAAGWERRNDLLIELIASIAESLGFRFSHTGLKTNAYVPKAMVDENQYLMDMRRWLLGLAEGKNPIPIRVEASQQASPHSATPTPPAKP